MHELATTKISSDAKLLFLETKVDYFTFQLIACHSNSWNTFHQTKTHHAKLLLYMRCPAIFASFYGEVSEYFIQLKLNIRISPWF